MSDVPTVWSPSTFAANARYAYGLNSFSATPTMAEINASSWLNQIIALVNRRSVQTIIAPTLFSYLDSTVLSAQLIADLRTRINAIRAAVGQSAYTFTGAASAGGRISAATLNELRTALAFSGQITPTFISKFVSVRLDNPFGTQVSAGNSSYPGGHAKLGIFPAAGGNTSRARTGSSWQLPAGVDFTNLPTSVVGSWGVFSNGLSAVNFTAYASNTDDSAGAGTWWENLDIVGATVTAGASGTGFISQIVTNAMLQARSEDVLSILTGVTSEISGVNSGESVSIASSVGPIHTLVIDFGFFGA